MNTPVKIIAHRGASGEAPENTVAAARLGWTEQADAVEIDVHLTRDGRVVAIHDPTLLRTTGRDARVDELTLEEIRRLDAGVWKGARWRG
ncbi:MAG TPA: glycerophosphodiester phosphodiesterase family protein, partial [Rariglobus sp.]